MGRKYHKARPAKGRVCSFLGASETCGPCKDPESGSRDAVPEMRASASTLAALGAEPQSWTSCLLLRDFVEFPCWEDFLRHCHPPKSVFWKVQTFRKVERRVQHISMHSPLRFGSCQHFTFFASLSTFFIRLFLLAHFKVNRHPILQNSSVFQCGVWSLISSS